MSEAQLPLYKIVFSGDFGVGKSSLMIRYTSKKFDGKLDATIGAAFKSTFLPNGVQVGMWDTAGHERYNSLLPMYHRGAHAVIYCIDSTQTLNMEKIKKDISNITIDILDDTTIFFVLTKCDAQDNFRQFKPLDEFVERRSVENLRSVYYTSSKTGENVEELFTDVGEMLVNIERRPKNNLMIESEFSKRRKDCCRV